MSYLSFIDLKQGDRVTILKEPYVYSHLDGGTYGVDKVEYPYTLTIKSVSHQNRNKQYLPHLAIQDTNGFGWAIINDNAEIFTRNSIIENRKNKINNINNETSN